MRSLSRLLLAAALSLTACHGRGPVAPPAHHPDPIVAPAVDRAALRARLAERRQQVVQRFLAYREARIYPVSPGPGRQHIWLDAFGHLCAAATLISADWGRDATVAAVHGNLALRIADVRTGPLADWVLTSGLTKQELVAIQVPPMDYPREPAPIDAEAAALYPLYVEVERQITSQWDENLDLAVERLAAQPALARAFLAGALPPPG